MDYLASQVIAATDAALLGRVRALAGDTWYEVWRIGSRLLCDCEGANPCVHLRWLRAGSLPRAFIQFTLPRTVLISPLWAMKR